MPRAVYLTQSDARDIRNIDELLSDVKSRAQYLADPKTAGELWVFFRALRVRLDKAGNKTKAWKPLKGENRARVLFLSWKKQRGDHE